MTSAAEIHPFMSSKRRSFETGHRPKFMVVVDDTPECRHIVGRFEIVSATGDRGQSLVMQGTLRIAGRERTVRARGALPILMTDYGISPPTALFGVVRTENRIVVKFDLLVDRPSAVASIGETEP